MATIAKSGTPSLATKLPPQNEQISGKLAAEAIAAGDPCYVKSDGTVARADGTAADAKAKVRGIAAFAAQAGEAVTLYRNVRFAYGSGLTPGADVYLGAGAGVLADAASTGGTTPIGYVVNATVIQFKNL